MTRNSATGICAKVVKIHPYPIHSTKQYTQKVTVQLDDQRTSDSGFSFYMTDAIYFPFKEGQEVVLTLKKGER